MSDKDPSPLAPGQTAILKEIIGGRRISEMPHEELPRRRRECSALFRACKMALTAIQNDGETTSLHEWQVKLKEAESVLIAAIAEVVHDR